MAWRAVATSGGESTYKWDGGDGLELVAEARDDGNVADVARGVAHPACEVFDPGCGAAKAARRVGDARRGVRELVVRERNADVRGVDAEGRVRDVVCEAMNPAFRVLNSARGDADAVEGVGTTVRGVCHTNARVRDTTRRFREADGAA